MSTTGRIARVTMRRWNPFVTKARISSTWLEYCAEGLRQTLDNVWLRVQAFNLKSPQKLVLRPRQEQLLKLLRDHGSMAPAEIWKVLDISRQGAMDLLHPLIEAGIIEKLGSKKNGRYLLRQP